MWVKICGIRDVETARYIAKCGADAIGLNFYSPSPRSVAIPQAQQIVAAIGRSILPVGLFVNHSVAQIRQICQECNLTTIQLHGDETPEMQLELRDFRIIRAFRVGPAGLAPVFDELRRCDELGVRPWACLIDAAVSGQFGGSGTVVDWTRLANEYPAKSLPPLILAGGLTPVNVSQAVKTVHPWGVDVASGVESSRGVKNLDLINTFVHEARKKVA